MSPVRPYERLLRRTIVVLVAVTGLAGVGVASAQASSPIAATQFA